MEWTISFVTLVAGVVTIIWFIRDVRKENSKLLKSILDVQKTSLETQKTSLEIQKTALDVQKTALEIQKMSLDVQKSIEEGQRKGFEKLAEMLLNQTEILARINSKLK